MKKEIIRYYEQFKKTVVDVKSSFKIKKPNKLEKTIFIAPNNAKLLPSSVEVNTYSCPNIANVLIKK